MVVPFSRLGTLSLLSVSAHYSRFPLSTDVAAANALGTAQDGEVKDYSFTIQNRVSLPPVFRRTVEIGEGLERGTENSSASLLGVDVAAIGDLNNDGVGDFAVTDIFDGVAVAENGLRGAVHIVFQNADGSVNSTTRIASGFSGGPTLEINDQFCASVTSLGDIDRDGIVDIAVGASGTGIDIEKTG